MVRPAIIIAALVAASCGAPAGLSTYPRRDIDRPFTLPADVNTWLTLAPMVYIGPEEPDPPDDPEPTDSEWVPPIPLPFGYEVSLGARVTLVGFVVPAGVRVELSRTPKQLFGMGVALGFLGFSSTDGLALGGSASMFHRYHLGVDWALESSIGTSYTYLESNDDSAKISLSTGPRIQLSDEVSTRPVIGASLKFEDEDQRVTPSLGWDIYWNFHSRWRVGFGYGGDLKALGERRTVHVGFLILTLYW